MRRIGLILFSFSALGLLPGCSKAPEPKKAQDVGQVQAADGEGTARKAGNAGADLPALPEGAVATVNGTDITLASFKAIYDLKLQKYEDRGREMPKTADRRYRKSITDRLIYQEVLRQEAQKRGLSHDADALAQREEAQKRGIKDWEKHLRRRGESDESLRQLYLTELLERAILEADGKLTVTDAEVDEEYEKIKPNYKKDKERVRAAHILIRVGPGEQPPPGEPAPEPSEEEKAKWKAEALAKANEVHALTVAEGADFAALAREHSMGPSARKGGDLGIFSADRMVEEFSKAAFALEPGQISEPIETKFGFHIIKVFGKYPAGDLPKQALEDQIRERLSARKLHQGRRDLKQSLMDSYEVKNTMEELLGPDPRAARRNRPGKGKGGPGKAAVGASPHGGGHGHGGMPAPRGARGSAEPGTAVEPGEAGGTPADPGAKSGNTADAKAPAEAPAPAK